MYTCGPTVYNYAHIGNARPAVVSDLLSRVLRQIYPKVTYVSNITDIDDKIIAASLETSESIDKITSKYEKIYNEDMKSLGVIKPDIQPHATDFIEEMINLVQKMIANKTAYVSEDHVLFDVTKYNAYGKLSGRNIEEQLAGSRVEVASYKKMQVILCFGNQAQIISLDGIRHGDLVGLGGILNVRQWQKKV